MMKHSEFNFRSVCGVLVSACVFSVASVQNVQAELAPQGGYIDSSPHPMFAEPPGKYHTRLAWLMASQIAYENRASTLDWFASLTVPGLYKSALAGEQRTYANLEGMAHYRYADALLRDVIQMQILTLQSSQMNIAADVVLDAVIADVATMVISAGISEVLPKVRQGVLALNSRYLQSGTEQSLIARYALIDMELRYRGFMDSAVFRSWQDQMATDVTAAEINNLVSESVMSTAIGTAIDAYRGSPAQMLELFRAQLVREVAAYNCACVLDMNIHQLEQATIDVLGSNGSYRTGLGFLLAQRLVPPSINPLNAMGVLAVNDLIPMEFAKIERLKKKEPARYGTYMRSLLVDLETLETEQIAALQSGATVAFLESTVLNVLFGAFAIGGGGGLQAMTILANAGYGGMASYNAVGAELQIRLQMAALREQVLDIILPYAESCGCGAGVVVVPRTVVVGDTANSQ